MVKNTLANARHSRDTGSIPGWGRYPGGGHGNPLQYSCLAKSMDTGAWQASVHRATENRIRLSTAAQHSTVPIPLSWLLGPGLPLTTMLSSSFTGMTINLAIGTILWTLPSHGLKGVRALNQVLPTIAQKEEQHPGEYCHKSTPQYIEKLHPQHDSHPMFPKRKTPST